MMKKVIVTLACCAMFAPLAFGQSSTQTNKRQKTTATEQEITITGTMITTTEDGAAANYQPVKTLVIRQDSSNKPGSYVLKGPGKVVNKKGEVVQEPIRPGTHVRVYYVNNGDQRTVDHVVVD